MRRRRLAVGAVAVAVAGCTAGAVLTFPGRPQDPARPLGAGLTWAARGDKAHDASLIAKAVAAWNAKEPRPVRDPAVLYAATGVARGDVTLPDTVVVLQARTADGTVRIGWVTTADEGSGLTLRAQLLAPSGAAAPLQIGVVVWTAVHGATQMTAFDLAAPDGYRVVIESLVGQELLHGETVGAPREFAERMVTAPSTGVGVERGGRGIGSAIIGRNG